MPSNLWRTAARGAALAVGGAALLAASRALGGGSAADFAAAGLGTLAAGGLAAFLVRLHYRRLLQSLERTTGGLRANPSSHLLPPASPLLLDPDTGPPARQVESLSGSYRAALAEVVRLRDEVEWLRSSAAAGAGRGERYPGGQSGAGSSRQRMVARLSPSLHLTAATPAFLHFLGRTNADLFGRPLLEYAHPEDALALGHALRDALRDGEAHNVTFRVPPRTAPPDADPESPPEERHLQMDAMTCYADGGELIHLRCHFVDVSDRVRTDRELRRRTAELSAVNDRLRDINADLSRLIKSYRDLYHRAPVLYFSLDEAGNFLAFNETLLRTLGYPRAALVGLPYSRLLTPASREALARDPGALHRTGEVEAQWVKHDGSVIDVWIGTTAENDRQGRFVRSRSAARDVTERNRLANALRGQAEELERANSRLRRTNQELEDFTYVVSHDLKEPLRTLEAFSTFLAQDYGPVLGAGGNDYIAHLIRASRRLRALIDDLLALSRAGKVTHAPRAFSWDDVLRTVLGDLRDLLQRRGGVVRVEGALPPAAGDPERVVQLLANLIGNGLKYNEAPRPEVVIGAAGDGGPDPEFAMYHVRDNGVGIDPQYHEQIFRIFRRLHPGEESEGTGAGLAICKRIAEAHGGRLWVESCPGHGSTFYFTLPRLAVRTAALVAGNPTTPAENPADGGAGAASAAEPFLAPGR